MKKPFFNGLNFKHSPCPWQAIPTVQSAGIAPGITAINVSRKTAKNYIRYATAVFAVIMAIGLITSISPKRTSGDSQVYYSTGKNYLARDGSGPNRRSVP